MFSGNRSLASSLFLTLFVACVLTVLCSLAPAVSSAAQVTLAWDPNTETDLSGYKLYYGPASGSYPSSVDVGNLTSYTLSGLLEGQIYYFAVTAYNLSLGESGLSNEVSKAIADVTSPTISLTAPVTGVTASGTVMVSASATDNVGVVGVQFKLDGVNLGAEDTTNTYSISWNSTLVANGTHTLTAVARDAAGNLTTSAPVSATVANDTIPPVISSVSAFNISSAAATITWATNEASDSQVEYGLTTAYGSSTPLNSSLLTAHAVTLTGLQATTLYHYRVKSRDAAGNLATSADFTLTTLIAVPDLTPPSGPTNLSASAVSSSQIKLSWTASTDNVGVAGYTIYRGGAQVGTTALTSYSDTSLSPSTTYTYTVAAYDAAGNVSALSASASAATLPPPPADIASGLGLYYMFDEGAGSLASDSSGNGNAGSLLGGTAWAAGKLGQALSFDGVSGNVTAATTAGLNLSTTLTMAAWINPSDVTAYRTIVAKGAFWQRGYGMNLINGKLNLVKVGIGDVTSSVLLSAGTWQHVAITWNAATSEVKFYLNGALAQTVIDASVVNAPLDSDNLLVGFWLGGGSYFAGAMDELRVYNRVLSAADISTLYTIAAPAPDTTPPTVSMTAPSAGSTVAGTVTVSANATDNVGVVGVQFKLDGANLGAEVTTAPYTTSWNTALAAIGVHTLTAVARDAAGNTATAPAVSLTVVGKPTITSFTPTSGPVGTMVTISGTDFTGVTAVTFNGVNGDPFTVTSATAIQDSVPMGATTGPLSVTTTGGMATSASVFTVVNDATPPAVSITAPVAGATVTGTITVSVSAADNVGVVGVQFKLDGANLGAEVTAVPYTTSWNTAVAAIGAHTLTAVARDAAGNTATATAVSVTVADTTPPAVSMTAPSAGSTVSGTISVSASATDNVGVVGVQFKLDGANLGAEVTTAPYLVSWNPTLATNGAHNLTAVARDAAGNTATSVAISVTVLNDTTPPTVSMTAPAAGATVGGTITVSASATDDVGVVGVQFKLDGVNLGSLITAAPYTLAWITTTASNGAHTLTAVARDAARNTATSSSVTVTVFNDSTPPAVSLTAPANGATVAGTVTISASATDNVGVVGVQFMLDGANLGAEVTTAPYATSWNTALASAGAHILTAVARDAAGNMATTASVSVTVADTTPPAVSMTAPSSGSTVSGMVTVSATASDNVGVAGVQFKLDGVNLGAEVLAAPYAISWATTAAVNGAHTLTAVARDAAGNTATAVVVSVTVFNDTTPPTVSMTAPSTGATVSGTITVSADATDNVGVVGVQFKLDGVNLGAEVTIAPYTLSWNTATASNGLHTLTAVARDAAGNSTASAGVSVTVADATVSITAPLNGATLTNLTKVKVQATSDIGLSSLQVYGDNILIGTVSCTGTACSDLSGSVIWHTNNNLAPGTHSLYAVTTDILGNSTSTAPIIVVK